MYAGYKLKPRRISDSTILQVEINNWDFSRDKSKLQSLPIGFQSLYRLQFLFLLGEIPIWIISEKYSDFD